MGALFMQLDALLYQHIHFLHLIIGMKDALEHLRVEIAMTKAKAATLLGDDVLAIELSKEAIRAAADSDSRPHVLAGNIHFNVSMICKKRQQLNGLEDCMFFVFQIVNK